MAGNLRALVDLRQETVKHSPSIDPPMSPKPPQAQSSWIPSDPTRLCDEHLQTVQATAANPEYLSDRVLQRYPEESEEE